MSKLKDLGEFGLIDLIAGHQPAPHGRLLKGIGDDCAVIAGEGDLVTLVTTDTMVEGVHFDLKTSTPEGLGAKLLAVNVSDVAAMGGEPGEAFLAVSADPDADATVIDRMVGGLQASGTRFGVQLAGGDTTATRGPLVLTLTLLGRCRKDEVVYRSGASAGERVYVTGTPGDAAAGLMIAQGKGNVEPPHRSTLLRRHHRPEPRVAVGRGLASVGAATAMIDVSDGLGGDLGHVAAQSGVDVILDPDRLPISEALSAFAAAEGLDPVALALSGGEDYELAFTSRDGEFPSEIGAECRLSYIGVTVPGEGRVRIGTPKSSQIFEKKGFDHFASR